MTFRGVRADASSAVGGGAMEGTSGAVVSPVCRASVRFFSINHPLCCCCSKYSKYSKYSSEGYSVDSKGDVRKIVSSCCAIRLLKLCNSSPQVVQFVSSSCARLLKLCTSVSSSCAVCLLLLCTCV